MTSEVKQRRARSVLGWGTAWEDLRVLSAFIARTFRTIKQMRTSIADITQCAKQSTVCNLPCGTLGDKQISASRQLRKYCLFPAFCDRLKLHLAQSGIALNPTTANKEQFARVEHLGKMGSGKFFGDRLPGKLCKNKCADVDEV